MQILIVDDEPLARSRLARLIDELEGCEVCAEAEDGEHALAMVQRCDPDLVLLDVRMPGEDGIAVAKSLAKIEDPPAVVFCTAYDEYALDAFDTMAQGYIVKPVQKQQLVQVIEKIKKLTRVQTRVLSGEQEQSSERKHISARTRKGMELIAIDQILYFYADHKYVTVVHYDGETLIDDTLKELEEAFSGRFIRVHRNALVALEKIEALERDLNGQNSLRLKQSEQRPVVSRRHLAGVKEVLANL